MPYKELLNKLPKETHNYNVLLPAFIVRMNNPEINKAYCRGFYDAVNIIRQIIEETDKIRNPEGGESGTN